MSEKRSRSTGGDDLPRNPANFAPLTPLTFISWSARVCPNRTAVIHGSRRFLGQKPTNGVAGSPQH
jgi:fatty-acyl-CoA synthase